MTNFRPFKDKIWEAARSGDKPSFEEGCKELMDKVANDIWRLGWEIHPTSIDDVYKMLDGISGWFHEQWLKAMECGDAPHEDVSPGEGPLLVKKVIEGAVAQARDGRHCGDEA